MHIKASASIRNNYNEISKLCKESGEPVYLLQFRCPPQKNTNKNRKKQPSAFLKKAGLEGIAVELN